MKVGGRKKRKKRKMEKKRKETTKAPKTKLLMETAQTQIAIQDSDVSFMNDTDEEIDTADIEEEEILDRNTQKNEMEIGDENTVSSRRTMGEESGRMEP